MMRLSFSAAVMLAAVSVQAGNVCVWTGAGADANWSTTENWQDGLKPKSGNDDTLVFPAGAVAHNDREGFGLKQIAFIGPGEVGLTGGKIVFSSGGMMISNDQATVTCHNDLQVNFAGKFFVHQSDMSLYGEVSIADGKTLTLQPKGGNPAGDGSSLSDNFIRFYGGVTGPNATLIYGLGRNTNSPRGVLLESAVKVKRFQIGTGYNRVSLTVCAGGQEWQELQVGFSDIIAGGKDVFSPTAKAGAKSYYSTGNYLLNGYDQTIDRFLAASDGINKSIVIKSDEPARLTMRATGDGLFGGRVEGRASLVWAPTDDYTFIATNVDTEAAVTVSTTTGDLVVSNGTFVLAGATFPSARNVIVAETAALRLETAASGILAGARTVVLDGTLAVSAAAVSPFAGAAVMLGAHGAFEIPEGTTVTVGALKAGGEWLTDGEKTGESWIAGGGTVKVDSTALPAGFAWKHAADGAWNIGSNWRDGTVPDGTAPVAVEAVGGAYEVTVPTATDFTKPLTIGNAGGADVTTVTLDGAVTMPGTSAITVTRGGRLDIPAGTSLTVGSDSSVAKGTRVLEVTDGGEMDVSGTFASEANFYGRLAVSGGGTVRVKTGGLFTFTAYGSTTGNISDNRFDVGSGGLLSICGGTFLPCEDKWGNSALFLTGGDIAVTDGGALRFKKGNTSCINGYGTIAVSDGFIGAQDNGSGTFQFQADGTTDGVFEIDLIDQGAFCATSSVSFDFGHCPWSIQNRTTMRLVFDSNVDNYLGTGVSIGVNQRNGSRAEMEIRRGRVFIASNGLKVSRRNGPDNPLSANRGAQLKVLGGLLRVDGENCGDHGPAEANYRAGFNIADGLPWDDKTSARQFGEVVLTDGIITNLKGRVSVGIGFASGVFRQSGGAFWSGCEKRGAFIGGFDGLGRWEMTGGTSTFKSSVYIGVGRTGEDASEIHFPFDTGTHALENTAEGVLDVEGGTFTTTQDIITGADGNSGLVIVGANGVVAARDLIVSNAADTVTVKVDGFNAGRIDLSGKLDVAAGTKLRILGAETLPDGVKMTKVMTFASAENGFALEDIEISDAAVAAGVRVVRGANSIKVGKPNGMLLLFR